MPADTLLGTLLRSLQTFTEQQDTPRLLGTAASLLTTLNNPLNVTLLTSQLLSAPAIWLHVDGLRTCMRLLSVFHSAAQALIKHENAMREKSSDEDFQQLQLERTLPKDDWIRAVVNGADDHSPRWRHLLLFGGLLLGFGPAEDEALSRSMRGTIETALVKAANLALQEMPEDEELGQETITLVLNHCFPLLSDLERSQLDYDALLPALMRCMLHSEEGLRSAYFLGAVDLDVQQASKSTFQWHERSASFQQIQHMLNSPLVSSLGPLSRLVGHSIEQAKHSWLVSGVMEDIENFSRTLHLQWRQTKLSEIDISEEGIFLDSEALEKTTPQLWKLLRSTLFGVVIVLRSAVGRMMGDRALANDEVAPRLACRALHTLRYLYFIASRTGSSTFSQYNFVSLATMDILSAYPQHSETFLRSIQLSNPSTVPEHPLDRNLDLFYLNTAEHFTLIIPSYSSESLFISPAAPYLAAGGNNNLLPIFEAAHSVMLAVFSAPQNAELTAKHLPFYIESLFNVFPANLTARQFRLAFKTLARLASPPAILAATQPFLAATLLELLRDRATRASTEPIFPPEPSLTPSPNPEEPPVTSPSLSEQAVLTLTLTDTLTQISLDLLEEWLPLAADMINGIEDPAMREWCQSHFWQTLVGGEMDPERSLVCHSWWSTQGGKEDVVFGREDRGGSETVVMSGALPDGGGEESKL